MVALQSSMTSVTESRSAVSHAIRRCNANDTETVGCRTRVPFGNRSLLFGGGTLAVTHYNGHRPHQSRGQLPPLAQQHPAPDSIADHLLRTRVLGGLINEYRYAA